MVESQSTRRLQWLLWLMLAWVVLIFGRLVELQVFRHDDLARQADKQQQKTVAIEADRGAILDRTGKPLARSVPVESVVVNPRRIPDRGVAADLLSRILDLDRGDLFNRLNQGAAHKNGFLWVKRKISPDEAVRLRSMNLDWVEFRQEMKRIYPRTTLASHVVGSTGYVGDLERGNAGAEMAFDKDLSGKPGSAQVYNDVRQNPYDTVMIEKPEAGADITLTLDPNLQFIAERELDKAAASSGAITGSAVVLNPSTGEILAMANYPRFDPNLPPNPKEAPSARSNLAITTPFEPGSVFKMITLAAALETTNLTPESMIDCGNGQIKLPGRIVYDTHKYSFLSMADVLAHSSNVGAIHVGMRVGDQNLYNYVRKFGFGQKTGLGLPGESGGILMDPKRWPSGSLASISMGYQVSATSMQLAVAGATVANGGVRVKPRLILSRQRPGGPVETVGSEPGERVLRPETAIEMRKMMEGVVLRGTGRGLANIKGYTSGGKTGSARIYDTKAHTYLRVYNATFVGFAPVSNPQVVIAVTLNRTTGGSAGFGGPVAAPVFREIALHALRMLDVPKDVPEKEPLENEITDRAPHTNLAYASVAVGSGDATSVTPPPVQYGPVSSGSLNLDRRQFLASGEKGVPAPDFQGMTLRAVLEESAALGWPVEVSGTGIAKSQVPAAGSPVRDRTTVRVQFGR